MQTGKRSLTLGLHLRNTPCGVRPELGCSRVSWLTHASPNPILMARTMEAHVGVADTITVYHGSPRWFERPDPDYAVSGDGRSACGLGFNCTVDDRYARERGLSGTNPSTGAVVYALDVDREDIINVLGPLPSRLRSDCGLRFRLVCRAAVGKAIVDPQAFGRVLNGCFDFGERAVTEIDLLDARKFGEAHTEHL